MNRKNINNLLHRDFAASISSDFDGVPPWWIYFFLAISLLVIAPIQLAHAQPPQRQQQPQELGPPKLASAPENEAYGWWYSKTPDPFSRPTSMSGRGTAAQSSGSQPANAEQPASPHGAGVAENVAAPGNEAEKPEGQAASHGGGSSERPTMAATGESAVAENQMPPQGTGEAGKPADAQSGGMTNGGQAAGSGQQSGQPVATMPVDHSFSRNRSPVQKLYLAVVGGEMPELAPEVFYRFTARTLERHGGVALGSSYHKAEVVRDGDTWRADFMGASFGTVEIYSRFKIGDRWVYSQHNYLHFLRAEDAEGLEMPERVELPSDWPQFVFPTSSYNDMPFRSIQTSQTVEFEIQTKTGQPVPTMGSVLEENLTEARSLDYASMSKKFSYTPPEDPLLLESGSRGSKKALVVVKLPDSGDIVTFAFGISRSRWSVRKLGWGLGALAGVGLVTAIIVIRRRRRFKYNDRD